jgi:GT2 family glycosyltransferase
MRKPKTKIPSRKPCRPEMATPPLTTIVVLSYNRAPLLERALASIARQTYRPCDVVVVDNRSPSSPKIHELVKSFPGVRLVSNDANLGFTGGMNRGLAEARGQYVYLTEDDIELSVDCIEKLVDYLETHPTVALAGPVMWNMRTPTIRCAGGDFTFGSIFRMSVNGENEPTLPIGEPFATKFLPGATIGARTSVLRELGGFHPAFFMYREDIELCARVLERGLGIAIVPAARVYHHDPPVVPDSLVLTFHKHKNLGALYLLHAPLATLPLFLVRYVIIDTIRCVFANRMTLPARLKAWSWVAMQSPHLLVERLKRA